MGQILTIYSFRRGTGKTLIAANLASLATAQGLRVGLVDANFQAPSTHILFGPRQNFSPTLNDYVWGRCEVDEIAHELTGLLELPTTSGKLFLVPGSDEIHEITRIQRGGYYIHLLQDLYRELIALHSLDLLVVDTSAGLSEESLLALAAADSLLLLLRPDHQDYQGSGMMVEVAERLGVPKVELMLNLLPRAMAAEPLRREIATAYGRPVLAALPYSNDVMALGSAAPFVLKFPDHPISQIIAELLAHYLSSAPPTPPAP